MSNNPHRLKYSNRITTSLLAVLLSVCTSAAQAGILDTINAKVTTVQNRTGTILNNTNGLQDVVSNVKGMRDGFRDGVISDLRETLGEAQDLAEFLKARRESAGDKSQYPDLAVLVTSMDSIASVLIDDPGKVGALEALSALLNVLPDKALAPIARAVSKAGVDAAFVDRINQMAFDLVELRDILKEIDAQEDQNFAVPIVQVSAIAAPVMVIDRCLINDEDKKLRLSRAAKTVKGVALAMQYFGKLMETLSTSIKTQKDIQIWGWVGISIDVKGTETVGKLMALLGDGVLALADKAKSNLASCDDEARQTQLVELDNQLLISNEAVLESNAILLEEICGLTRYRSANCQALQP
ncbi:MAG: hypothetical protein WBN96_02425 [Gammaproteobacteria bacterium]